MAYKALYRTYRPQKFEEVVGQDHIVRTLKNAILQNKIAHAYLFCGPRGTGKTTMAKLFAKALNCEEGVGHQCDKCENCLSVIEGRHPDVVEIDAASNNGVDEIRDLIDKVKYGAILGKKKVYIIDEVHMLSTGAFNALLKTLEEPPEHVIFILATTEPYKILPTILSRCQRYDFAKVNNENIIKRLKFVLDKEHVNYSSEALDVIAGLADGGMRDALSMLDQVLAYTGGSLNVEDVLDIFSLESKEEKLKLIEAIYTHNFSLVLEKIKHYIEKGTDIPRFVFDLLTIFKDALIYEKTMRQELLEVLTKEEAICINDSLMESHILQIIDILQDTIKDFKRVSSINTIFEISLLKLCSLGQTPIVNAPLPTASQKEDKPTTPVKEETASLKPSESVSQTVTTSSNNTNTNHDLEKITSLIYLDGIESNGKYQINDDLMVDIMVCSKRDIKTNILKTWNKISLYGMHKDFGNIANILSDCHPLVASNKIIILESASNKNVEILNNINNQLTIQTILYNALKINVFIYAVNRFESVRLQELFKHLSVANKLPKISDVTLNIKEKTV